jgi:hypothetical protein
LLPYTGDTPFQLSYGCWQCNPSTYYCSLEGDNAAIYGVGNITTNVSISSRVGGFRLTYWLYNLDYSSNNSFQALVSSINGAFAPIVVDDINSTIPPQLWTDRDIAFDVPVGTSSIALTFAALQQVSDLASLCGILCDVLMARELNVMLINGSWRVSIP